MKTKSRIAGLLTVIFLLLLCSGAQGRIATLVLQTTDFATYTTPQAQLGTFHTVKFSVPEEVVGKRLDLVILELYVDVSINDEWREESAPVIEVLPLTAAFAGNGVAEFVPTSTAVRNVIPGERKKLLLDITGIVKGWIAAPESNHELIIGTLTGPKEGTFALRDGVLGAGNVAKVTFAYQNCFGERAPH